MPTARPLLFCLLALASAVVIAQGPTGPVGRPGLIAVHATTATELRAWDSTVDRMVRSRELVIVDSRPDPDIDGRTHETLLQYYQGIPVFGASLSRQTAQGVALSIMGTVYEDISAGVAPTLNPDQAVLAVAGTSGARRVGDAPQLVIFPTVGGCRRCWPAVSAARSRWGAISSTTLDTPMANLLLTIMDGGGVHLEKFGDSNGRILEPLLLS
jgi:hypothetical protein